MFNNKFIKKYRIYNTISFTINKKIFISKQNINLQNFKVFFKAIISYCELLLW